MRTEAVDVNAAVKDVMNLVDADARADGIRVTTTYAEGLAPVRCNAIQMQQVLLNLGEHIFHPFVTTKRDGLGVGLAISRSIVQSCGGTLAYRDNPAGGAIFGVELPAVKEEVLEQQEPTAER